MLKAITLIDLPPDDDEKDDEDIEEDEFQPVQVPEISYKTLKTEHHTCFAHSSLLLTALSKLNTSTVYWGKFQS